MTLMLLLPPVLRALWGVVFLCVRAAAPAVCSNADANGVGTCAPRKVSALNAEISTLRDEIRDREAKLSALRQERREALQLARSVGDSEPFASRMEFPSPSDSSTQPAAYPADKWLKPLAWFESGAELTALAIVPAPAVGNQRWDASASYYVLGDMHGRLHVYRYPAESMLSMPYDTRHKAAITAIAFGLWDHSLLVTAAADGSIHIHNLTRPVLPRRLRRMPSAPDRAGAAEEGPPPPLLVPSPLQVRNECSSYEIFGSYISCRQYLTAAARPDKRDCCASLKVSFRAAASSLPGDNDGRAVTCLQVYLRRRQEMIVAAHANGAIRILFANGTEMLSRSTRLTLPPAEGSDLGKGGVDKDAAVQVPSSDHFDEGATLGGGVVAMRASFSRAIGQYLALTTGSDIRFFDLKRMAMSPTTCIGVASNGGEVITSLEYDPLVPNALYAGTEQGMVLVARVVADNAKVECRIVGRLLRDAGQRDNFSFPGSSALHQPLRLATMKGYLLASAPSELFVFNTTRMHHGRHGFIDRLCFTRPHNSDTDVELEHSPLLGMNTRQTPYLVLSSKSGVMVFNVSLPYEDTSWDPKSTRTPMFFAALAIVIVYQVCKGKSRDSELPDPGGGLELRGGSGAYERDLLRRF